MAAPSFIQEAETTFNIDAASKTTASFSVLAGDVLVAVLVAENDQPTPATISGGSLTWTQAQSNDLGSNAGDTVWTAIVDANKSMTVTVTPTGNTGSPWWGVNVLTFRGSDGVGASAKTNGSGAPSLNITTTQANSAIVVANGDWNAIDGTSRTWRSVNGSAATEQTYFRDGTRYAAYVGYHADAGAAGSKTVGLSAPTGQKFSIIAVEVKGTAGGGGTDYSQNIGDGITGTDVIAKAAAQSRNDGLAGTDSRATAWVASRTIADAAALIDAAAKSAAHPLTDAATLTDASARSVKHPLADGGALTDAASKTASHAIADAGALTDATTHAWAAALPLSDAGALTDNVDTGGATGHTESINDGIAATDATAKTVTHPLADAIGATDAAAKAVAHPVDDGIAGTDARAKTAGHSVADPIAATDTPTHAWAAKLTQADPAALTDFVNTGGSTNHTRTINDSLAGTDATAKAPAHPVSDAISATDARARQIAVALAELAALTDVTAQHWTARLAFADTATIGDLMVVNARRWLVTPQAHWPNNPTGSRWDVDPSTRWPPVT